MIDEGVFAPDENVELINGMIIEMYPPDNRPSIDGAAALSPWRITSERYLEMIREGVIGPDDRVELINGMIIEMSPAGPSHADVIDRLNELLFPIRGKHRIRIQSTMVLSEGQIYDPDFMLLKPRPSNDSYKDRHPGADDVALVIEVAGSSLAKDREIKLPVYAAAVIAEFWLIDLETETVSIHREPVGEAYQSVQTVEKGGTIDALCLPGQVVSVSALFD